MLRFHGQLNHSEVCEPGASVGQRLPAAREELYGRAGDARERSPCPCRLREVNFFCVGLSVSAGTTSSERERERDWRKGRGVEAAEGLLGGRELVWKGCCCARAARDHLGCVAGARARAMRARVTPNYGLGTTSESCRFTQLAGKCCGSCARLSLCGRLRADWTRNAMHQDERRQRKRDLAPSRVAAI